MARFPGLDETGLGLRGPGEPIAALDEFQQQQVVACVEDGRHREFAQPAQVGQHPGFFGEAAVARPLGDQQIPALQLDLEHLRDTAAGQRRGLARAFSDRRLYRGDQGLVDPAHRKSRFRTSISLSTAGSIRSPLR